MLSNIKIQFFKALIDSYIYATIIVFLVKDGLEETNGIKEAVENPGNR